ncbi:signal peptidase I [Nocardioides albidus]|uniref:Signal peptidase I n=1 Tax=Nocardioides albidus TaxID=1517589 RepID=A0A5C4VSE8_9ACTN|nr:Ig-like domain-containing protein [Nocardioides albidus]TNM38279.1 signal peptidase I [Nocardioides albidus]
MRLPTALRPAVLVLLGAALALATTGLSDATYVASSTNTATVRAAADWTPPAVVLADPGTPVQGTVTLAASASDAESGIASVAFQYLAPGASTWTTVCTSTAAPYSCAWSTRAGADGGYGLRARAVDGAGYTAVSDVVSTTVANNVLVVLGDPGDVVRGAVALKATVYNGGALPWLVSVQYTTSGGSSWKPLCSGLSAPFTCTWSTTAFANDSFDLRAVATAGVTTTTSAVVSDVLVDNAAPTVAMTDPGSPLSGTATFAATVSDAGSGVQQVVLQYAAAGGGYQGLCTLTTEPYTCRFATTSLPDGAYSFRAVATDVAGNTATSAALGNRIVDNTVSSVSVDDPGAFLSGTIGVTAQGNSTAGVVSVHLQYAATGTTTWTDLCADPAAPYTCTWDTTTVANGSYDLRALLLDSRGTTTVSAVVAGRRVDNSRLRAVDVQTGNGEGTVGRVDAGDTLTLTYSEVVAPGTVTSGWSGAALPVTLRLRDGNLVGGTNRTDTVDVLRNGAAVHLGSVNLREDYVKGRKTALFNATLTATTVTVDGVERTVVTLVVGTLASGNGLRTVTTPSTLAWTPATAALSASGGACAATPAYESGSADREF